MNNSIQNFKQLKIFLKFTLVFKIKLINYLIKLKIFKIKNMIKLSKELDICLHKIINL